ncbi:uncharacterized protein LOC128988160 isoform X2 [Macrosteles quadrilineatus]|uniref:uncharacterized protein LOC128988160 isoform X2 n=1 Tax=Macrosteles quadrilineatus TaxID=74068 RepID=UPI0023E24206|nr:uncharacterized protein LOC128988160 isoform X2 [Macrosteles quadrilineatus]
MQRVSHVPLLKWVKTSCARRYCFGCKTRYFGEELMVKNMIFHIDCFKCTGEQASRNGSGKVAKKKELGFSTSTITCNNCGTDKTSRWRNNKTMCNACFLWPKHHRGT